MPCLSRADLHRLSASQRTAEAETLREQVAVIRQQYAESFPATDEVGAAGCAPEPWLEASLGDDWLGASSR
jgi:hypothetical protein